ncbi:zf-HC2 domain-containing protein [Chitinimonas lacunae]|uniref:Zf-HC2 domain-containing protein n=1 Tax=Chitinimonas lacunae TaxID=1963018 RepID=A0ABV8MNS3_9NEIS
MMLSCKQATRLLSAAMDRELTRTERWSLRWHVLKCAYCRRFGAQIGWLRQAARQRPDSGSADE